MDKKNGRILYLCNGEQCPFVVCDGKGPAYYSDNRIWCSECKHTTRVEYAKNGRVKGPINFIKRFEIHFKPWIYFVEKEDKR